MLSLFTAVLMTVTVVTFAPMTSSADSDRYGVLSYKIEHGEVTITDCDETASGELEIPGTIDGYPVKNIGGGAFRDCSSLTSIELPDSIMGIGYGAFSGCYGLTNIVIPDGVTYIGHYAFEYCYRLKSITLPDGATSIGDFAFKGCSSLTSIVIPKGVTSIGIRALRGCNAFVSIQVDEDNPNYTSVDDVLYTKDKTKLIYCPEGKKEVEILSSVTSIEEGAFEGCSGLTSITLPDGVTSIGNGAFEDCSSLTSIDLPDSVKNIGYFAFEDCRSLTSIVIPKGVTSIEPGTFYECRALASVVIPDGVTSIDGNAFYSCNALTSIVIPDSVTSIGSMAFGWCGALTSVVIPKGVTSIGDSAFRYCTDLCHVLYSGTEDEWNSISIQEDNEYLTNATRHCEAALSVISAASEIKPTCNSEGKTIYHCSICDDGFSITLPRLAHSGEALEFVAPTCSQHGYTIYRCLVCAEEYHNGYFSALGHDWSADETDDGAGSKSRYCLRCGEIYKEWFVPVCGYTDVANDAWYYDAVNYVLSHKIFNGMSATIFQPDTPMTRGMVVEVLYNLEGRPGLESEEIVFTDVKAGDWYAEAVMWAEANGVVYGKTDTTFAPDENVTREQLAAILYRYASLKKYDVTATAELASFPDGDKVSGYAEDAIKWTVGAGLISGNKINGVNMIDARGNATRAQVAVILRGFCETIVK